MSEPDDYYAHWTAADWQRLNEQIQRDRERIRRDTAFWRDALAWLNRRRREGWR